MKELAEYYNDSHIVCMYAADAEYTGVDMADANFRKEYCQTASDVSHLNANGMYMVAPKFDKWIAEAYAKFKGATLTNSAEVDQFLKADKPEDTNNPDQSATPDATTAPENNTTEPVDEEGGCGSMISGIAIIAILGTAVVIRKKD